MWSVKVEQRYRDAVLPGQLTIEIELGKNDEDQKTLIAVEERDELTHVTSTLLTSN